MSHNLPEAVLDAEDMVTFQRKTEKRWVCESPHPQGTLKGRQDRRSWRASPCVRRKTNTCIKVKSRAVWNMPRSWLMSPLLFIPVARTEWTLTAWTCFQNSFLIPLSLGEEYGYCLPRVRPFSTHWLLQITSGTQISAVDGKHFV